MIPRASAYSEPCAIERERGLLRRRVHVLAAQSRRAFLVDVLVVAGGRLRRRREDRFGQARGLLEPVREAVSADHSGLAVVLPPRPGEVSADHALDREHLEPRAHHRPAVLAQVAEVVRHDVAGAREPERREPGEDASLVRNRRPQHDVEGRYAIARDERERLLVQRVDLANLPATDVDCLAAHERSSFARAAKGAAQVVVTPSPPLVERAPAGA